MHFNAMENVPCYKPQVWFTGVLIEDKDRRVSLWYSPFTLKSVQFQRQMHSAQSSQLKCRLLFSISRDSTKNAKESAIMAYLQRQHRNWCWLGTAKENTCYLNKQMCIHICIYLHIQSSHTHIYHIMSLYKRRKKLFALFMSFSWNCLYENKQNYSWSCSVWLLKQYLLTASKKC